MATTPEAFSRAVGASMRAEIAAAGLNVAGVAKQMGISRPVLTNYIAGVRSAPISVIQRLAEVLEIQPDTIVRRAQERLADAERQAIQAAAADAPAGRVIKMAVVPELPNRGSLPRKLNLLVAAMPADRRTADIFQVVQGALTEQGIAILKRDWEAVLAGESVVTLSDEALGVIAKLFAVNPSYLTDNDPNLEESVDSNSRSQCTTSTFKKSPPDQSVGCPRQISASSPPRFAPPYILPKTKEHPSIGSREAARAGRPERR